MRVLVADDCPVIRMRLKKHLIEWGFEPVLTCDGREALAALTSKFAPRLAVVDWMMPIMDGLEVTRNLRNDELGKFVYVVMLTGKTDKDDLVTAFDAGIDDYLTKPFDVEELHQRLRAGQRILQLQDQLNDTLDQLKFQATHDALTGIWNRRAILETLERELNRACRNTKAPEATSIALLDIDRFKSINDTFGHLAGDSVLKTVGDTIKKSLRIYDYVGRYGGEEFIVILPTTARKDVETVVERIRANIENTRMNVGGLEIKITASLGVVTAEENSYVEDLIKDADDAMYNAKMNGRNRITFFDQMSKPIVLGNDEPSPSVASVDSTSMSE